jgi:hypothetical protein
VVIFPFGQASSQTSSVTVPKTISEASSQTDLITGLRTDQKTPDLLGGHVDLLDGVETQALAFQNGDSWRTCRCVGTVAPGKVVVEGHLLVAYLVVPSGVGAIFDHFSNQSTNQSKAGSEINAGPIHLLLIFSGFFSFPRGSVIGAIMDQFLDQYLDQFAA